jgi:hypothetical protein
MIVLMGGSGSTGSSLLKNILNRHPSIFAGEESNYFCKRELYLNFTKNKKRIPHRGILGLKNFGWHIYNGIDLVDNHNPITNEELYNLIDQSDTFAALSQSLKEHFTSERKEQIWLEKTPANASSFSTFLSHFPEGKVIHITRHPLDTIASLISRGYDLFYATGIYLINTASAMNVMNHERSLLVQYENLIQNSEREINRICDFLGVERDLTILKSKQENVPNSKLDGWTYDETENIGKKSIGRFEQLNPQTKSDIIHAINTIKVSPQGCRLFDINLTSIPEIARSLNYSLPLIQTEAAKSLKKSMYFDRLRRMFRGYKTGFTYPLTIQ